MPYCLHISGRSKLGEMGVKVFIAMYGYTWAWLLCNHHYIIESYRTYLLITSASKYPSTYGDLEDPTDSVIYGPSTENKIERWWKELLERMEMYFKNQLSKLLEDGDYDQHNKLHRYSKLLVSRAPAC